MAYFLDKIRAHVIERVAKMRVEEIEPEIRPDFCQIFRNKKPVIISEVKFASPSRGLIYQGNLSPVQIAHDYIQNGATALSVLTEPDYFKGDIDYIRQIRSSLPDCPILLKDFVLAPIQIQQAHAAGANAVLLIVGFLEPALLHALYEYAVSLGLTPLIEVHDDKELDLALTLKPQIIGINNRNLKTLKIDLETSRNLIQAIPDDIYAICESGLTTLVEIQSMTSLGFDGFLIGSHMMQSNHPGQALHNLLQGLSDAR